MNLRFHQDLQSQELFDGSNTMQLDCLRYCFMSVLQRERDGIAREWNAHRTRRSLCAEAPGGIPDILYFAPEAEGKLSLPVTLLNVYL